MKQLIFYLGLRHQNLQQETIAKNTLVQQRTHRSGRRV